MEGTPLINKPWFINPGLTLIVIGPTLLLSFIASLEGHLADLAADNLCGLPLGIVWPWPAEVPLCALLLKAIHEVVPPPPLSPDPGVSDGRAGAAKEQWVSLLLVLFCDIASVAVLHTTSVYTSPIDGW